ncbi:MAG: PQQ-dependent sugar dehydrogenase [Ignavibacteria bacterium]|nr:PQQ-dependent sugar dehydrogenase [Ignavibacteria bacterium]
MAIQILRCVGLALLLFFLFNHPVCAQKDFTLRVVATNLEIPWEIEWGPDGMLWVTERPGIVSRIDPETGTKQVVLDIQDSVYAALESGLLGFVLHPDFLQIPYIYLTYVGGDTAGDYRVVKRYEYVEDTLIDPVEIYRISPAGYLHNGSRLAIGSDGMLYVTTGDHYQEFPALDENSDKGKILRMKLDGSVPYDNPIPGRYMWSKGHRNVQGLVQLPNGSLWASEHGNNIEDEVNLIVKGGNYGWPRVEGPCDEEYEIGYCDSNNVLTPKWSSGGFTVAPAGIEYYNSDRYPVFANSILLATLKHSTLFQLRLNDDGDSIVQVLDYFRRSIGRIRDIAISPDGRIFLCSSNREPNGVDPFPEFDDDKIVEVIPVPDSAIPIYSAPDTMFVKARVGDEFLFHVPVSNIGTAPFRIQFVGELDTGLFLRSDQWRVPITVLPGRTYPLNFVFKPPVDSEYFTESFIATDSLGNFPIYLKGSTVVGVLDATIDTLVVQCRNCSEESIRLWFVNTGTDTVTVTGATIEGDDMSAFEIVAIDTGVVQPADSASVTVRYIGPPAAVMQSVVRINTTSYRDAYTTLFVTSSTSVGSEASGELPLYVYPNPFSSTISFIIPPELIGETISLYNLVGSLMYSLDSGTNQVVEWDPASSGNVSFSTGAYLAFVTNGKISAMTLIYYFGQ